MSGRPIFCQCCDKRVCTVQTKLHWNEMKWNERKAQAVDCVCVYVKFEVKLVKAIVCAGRVLRIISIYIILLNVDTWISSQWEFFNELFAHYMSWSICIWCTIHITTAHSGCVCVCVDGGESVPHVLSQRVSEWMCQAVSANKSLCMLVPFRFLFYRTQNVMCLNRFFMRFLLCW